MTVHHHHRQAHQAVAAVIVHRRHPAHPVVIHPPANRIIQITTVQNAQKMAATNRKPKKLQSKRSTANDVMHRHHHQVLTKTVDIRVPV